MVSARCFMLVCLAVACGSSLVGARELLEDECNCWVSRTSGEKWPLPACGDSPAMPTDANAIIEACLSLNLGVSGLVKVLVALLVNINVCASVFVLVQAKFPTLFVDVCLSLGGAVVAKILAVLSLDVVVSLFLLLTAQVQLCGDIFVALCNLNVNLFLNLCLKISLDLCVRICAVINAGALIQLLVRLCGAIDVNVDAHIKLILALFNGCPLLDVVVPVCIQLYGINANLCAAILAKINILNLVLFKAILVKIRAININCYNGLGSLLNINLDVLLGGLLSVLG